MQISYVGLISEKQSKALVLSAYGRYYVWTSSQEEIEKLRTVEEMEVPNTQLKLASEYQIEVGRGSVYGKGISGRW